MAQRSPLGPGFPLGLGVDSLPWQCDGLVVVRCLATVTQLCEAISNCPKEDPYDGAQATDWPEL